MALTALVEHKSFAAGEVSPLLYARDDLARYQTAAARLENFAVMLEGGLARAPGTKFVLALKTESEIGVLVPFRYSGSDSYMLVFNGGKMRVLRNGGFVLSGATPYELTVPYVAADLPNLRYQQFDNTVRLVCKGYESRVLTRVAHDNWTLSLYQPTGGPVGAQNLDTAKTIKASAVSGSGITLTGVNTAFTANDVGGVFRLDEPDLTKVPQWKPSEVITSPITALSKPATTAADFTAESQARDGDGSEPFAQTAQKASATAAFYFYDYGAGTEEPVSKALVHGSNDVGFVQGSNPEITIKLYGKQTTPTLADPGTQLSETTFTDTGNESGGRELYSNDVNTAWRYIGVVISQSGSAATISLSELTLSKWTGTTPTNLRRYNGRVYAALNDGDTGPNPPVHDEGDASSGRFNVIWRFKHNTYGFVRITAYTSATSLTGTVISLLPDSVLEPTYRWFPPAWSPGEGWPEQILAHDNRLWFARRDVWWMTRPSDPNSLELLPVFDVVDPDSALAQKIAARSRGIPWIEWALSSSAILLGLRDEERVIRASSLFDPLTVGDAKPVPATSEGSAPQIPADVDDGAIFIGRSRQRLHFVSYENLGDALNIEEVTTYNRRILKTRADQLAWQRDPHRILWISCQDGALVGCTFMPKQQVLGLFRRVLKNGYVEDVKAIPSSDEAISEVYLIVRRTINGSTHRYVERMQEFFEPASETSPTAAGAWYVDSGLRLQNVTASMSGATQANPVVVTSTAHPFVNGDVVRISGVVGMTQLNGNTYTVAGATANTFQLSGIDGTAFGAYSSGGLIEKVVTSISGLSHLEGQTVRVFADGQQQADKVVSSGAITITAANDVLVGLPLRAYVKSLPMNVETRAGSSKHKMKGASHVLVDQVEAAGGLVRVNGGAWEELNPTGGVGYGVPLPLATGPRWITVEAASDLQCVVELECDNALPFTLAGLSPDIEVEQG